MEPGYYWAKLFGDEITIVRVIINDFGIPSVDTFLYGWQSVESVDFLHDKPLIYGNGPV